MRSAIRTTVLAGVFLVLLFGSPEIAISAADTIRGTGTQEDPFIAPNLVTLKLAWQNTNPDLQIERASVQILDEAGVFVKSFELVGIVHFPKAEPLHTALIHNEIKDLPNGLYQMQAKLTDIAWNVSEWSAAIWIRKQWTAVKPPGGCVLLR